jgi:predicted aldo/keto reductase-like oxidoreductase
MEHRVLGKTGLKVSAIGLGTEYLNGRSRDQVVSVVRSAIDNGVNYFDVVFAFPEFRDNLAAAFQPHRGRVLVCGHICCAISKSGHYRLSREVKENDRLFHDLLQRLGTDHVDIVMIQMVNELTSYENVCKPGGVMDLAYRLKKQGKARFIGISGHKVPAVAKTIRERAVDVVMFPVNIAWDMTPGRKEIYEVCNHRKIGLVAMKIYGGGRVLRRSGRGAVTPVQCVSYALDQKGVATVVPGVRNMKELDASLAYLKAPTRVRSYRKVLKESQEELQGNCVYCNHCLPCPVGIDIGRVISRWDRIQAGKDKESLQNRTNYYYPARLRLSRGINFKGLSDRAEKCTECGACVKRCPFGVDIIGKMKQAAQIGIGAQ